MGDASWVPAAAVVINSPPVRAAPATGHGRRLDLLRELGVREGCRERQAANPRIARARPAKEMQRTTAVSELYIRLSPQWYPIDFASPSASKMASVMARSGYYTNRLAAVPQSRAVLLLEDEPEVIVGVRHRSACRTRAIVPVRLCKESRKAAFIDHAESSLELVMRGLVDKNAAAGLRSRNSARFDAIDR